MSTVNIDAAKTQLSRLVRPPQPVKKSSSPNRATNGSPRAAGRAAAKAPSWHPGRKALRAGGFRCAISGGGHRGVRRPLMRVLLDTQVLLWALAEPTMMDAQTRAAIEAGDNEVLFSLAGIWEIAIKAGLGRSGFSFDTTTSPGPQPIPGLASWRFARTRPPSLATCRCCNAIRLTAFSWRRRSSSPQLSTPPTGSSCPIRT